MCNGLTCIVAKANKCGPRRRFQRPRLRLFRFRTIAAACAASAAASDVAASLVTAVLAGNAARSVSAAASLAAAAAWHKPEGGAVVLGVRRDENAPPGRGRRGKCWRPRLGAESDHRHHRARAPRPRERPRAQERGQ